jgi:hypothetical protein
MNTNHKKKNCHSGQGHHKAHGLMMLLCVLLMVGIPFLTLSSTMSTFSFPLLATALLPLILCLVMHGVMMKFMMSDSKQEQTNSQENAQEKIEVKMIEQKSSNTSRFNA